MNEINQMIEKDFPNVNEISIMQNNKIILRENYNGFQNNALHKVGCIFKSFISALVGISLKENLINSLDQKLVSFFADDLPNDIDDRFYNLTLKHILTNTSGISWPGPTEDIPDNMHGVFKLTMKDNPGAVFEYKPDPQIMIYLIEKLTGKEFIDYIDEKLMRPLGIKRYKWERSNIEDMHIEIDELIKLGELYLNKGKRKGVALFSEAYYYESIKPQTPGGFPENTAYGYYWWADNFNNTDYFYASGFGGQILCVIPDLNIITAIVSKMDRPHTENKVIIHKIIDSL